jgi:hypothetical protein
MIFDPLGRGRNPVWSSRKPNVMASSSPSVPLGHSVSWALVGNVFYAICQWGAVVLLARMGSVEVLGRFALALALTAPVFLLAGFQLRAVLATDAREQFRFTDYVALRLLAMLGALLAVGLLAPWNSGDTFATVAFIGLAKSFEGLSDVHYGQHQRMDRMDRVARSLVFRGALGLLGIAVGLRIAGTASAAAAGMAAAWFAVLLLYDIGPTALRASARDAGAALRWSNASRILALTRLSFPLGLVLMLVSLQSNIPRYFLEAFGGSKALGAFAALSSFVSVGIVMVGALGQSASPRMARRFAGGDYPAWYPRMDRVRGRRRQPPGPPAGGAVPSLRARAGVAHGDGHRGLRRLGAGVRADRGPPDPSPGADAPRRLPHRGRDGVPPRSRARDPGRGMGRGRGLLGAGPGLPGGSVEVRSLTS